MSIELPQRLDEALHVAYITPHCISMMGGAPSNDDRRAAEQFLMDLRQQSNMNGYKITLQLLRIHTHITLQVDVDALRRAQVSEQGPPPSLLDLITQSDVYKQSLSDDVVATRDSRGAVNKDGTSTPNLRLFWALSSISHFFSLYNMTPLRSLCSDVDVFDTLFGWVLEMIRSDAPVTAALMAQAAVLEARKHSATVLVSNGTAINQQYLNRLVKSLLPPEFILNKHAQSMVVGLQTFYPDQWSNFFPSLFELVSMAQMASQAAAHNLTTLLANGSFSTDDFVALSVFSHLMITVADIATLYVLRVFECIDERVVCSAITGGERDGAVKDGMRRDTIAPFVTLCFNVLREYYYRCTGATIGDASAARAAHRNNPNNTPLAAEVMRSSFSVLILYVHWIEISLLLTPEWLSLLYFFTNQNALHYVVVKTEEVLQAVRHITLTRSSGDGVISPSISTGFSESATIISKNTKIHVSTIMLAAALGGVEILNRIVCKKQLPLMKYDTVVIKMNMIQHCVSLIDPVATSMLKLCGDLSQECNALGLSYDNDADNTQTAGGSAFGIGDSIRDDVSLFATGHIEQAITAIASLCIAITQQLVTAADASGSSTLSSQAPLHPQQAEHCISLIHNLFIPHLCDFLVTLKHCYQVREIVYPFLQEYLKTTHVTATEALAVLQLLYEHSIMSMTINSNGIVGGVISPHADNGNSLNSNSNSFNMLTAITGIFENLELLEGINIDCWKQQRSQVYLLIRVLFKKDNALVLSHVTSLTQQVVEAMRLPEALQKELDAHANEISKNEAVAQHLASAVSPAVVESVIRYVYELGEAVRIDAHIRQPSHELTRLVYMIIHSNFCHYPHSGVHLTLFTLYDRYHAFFEIHRDNIHVLLKQILLWPCGMLNPLPRVRSQICTIFKQLCSRLKMVMQPDAPEVARALLAIFETQAQQQAAMGVSMVSGGYGMYKNGKGELTTRNRNANASSLFFTTTEKCTLFEGIGILLSVSDVYMCRQLANKVLEHILMLPQLQHQQQMPMELIANLIADDISFLAALAKGTAGIDASKLPESPPLMGMIGSNISLISLAHPTTLTDGSNSSNTINTLNNSPLQRPSSTAASSSPASIVFGELSKYVLDSAQPFLAYSSTLRECLCQFLHQLINMLGSNATEFVLQFVYSMFETIQSAGEVTKILRVVDQFVRKGRGDTTAVVGKVLLPKIVERLGVLLSPVSSLRPQFGIISELHREEHETYRTFIGLLLVVVSSSSCSEALLMKETRETVLGPLIEFLQVAVGTGGELEIAKGAIQTLSRMISLFVGVSVEEYSHIQRHQHFPAVPNPNNPSEHMLPPEAQHVCSTFDDIAFTVIVPRVLEVFTRAEWVLVEQQVVLSGPTTTTAAVCCNGNAAGGEEKTCRPMMNLNDGKTYLLTQEFAALLKLLVTRTGATGVMRLFEVLSQPPILGGTVLIPPVSKQIADALCRQLQQESQSSPQRSNVSATFKSQFRRLLEELQRTQVLLLLSRR